MISLKEFLMNNEEPMTLNPEDVVAKLSSIHLRNATPEQTRMYKLAYDKFLDRRTDPEYKKELTQILEKALLKNFNDLEDWYELEDMHNKRQETLAKFH
jgi:uncharacterized Ntn-hydrolase superfamily protein